MARPVSSGTPARGSSALLFPVAWATAGNSWAALQEVEVEAGWDFDTETGMGSVTLAVTAQESWTAELEMAMVSRWVTAV